MSKNCRRNGKQGVPDQTAGYTLCRPDQTAPLGVYKIIFIFSDTAVYMNAFASIL